MRELLQGLNEQQAQAVISASPLILCLAGAGSGKTTVLTKRVANLYLNRNVSVENMLCLTFTRLAGKEMKERVTRLIGADEGEKLFCNTFHAFAVAVLKKHGWVLGIEENFAIYDQETREVMLKRIIFEFGGKTTIKKVNDCFATCDDYREEQRKRPEECRVLMEYGYRCKRNNAVDLDRLIDLVIRLWELRPEILAEYRNQYLYVFVDEFQDTNDEQARMVNMLQAEHLFVVGDDFQAIYGWRGAKVQFIIDFAKNNPKCEVIKLEHNYRSTKEIVALANRLIKHNVNQTDKTLIAHKSGREPVETTHRDQSREICSIMEIVQVVNTEGVAYKDIAVLARTNKFIEDVQFLLKMNNIPYIRVSSADDPFKLPSVKKVLDWMELLCNTSNDMALKKCARHLECSEVELSRLELEALKADTNMYDLVQQNNEWQYMRNAISDFQTEAADNRTALYLFKALANANVFRGKLKAEDIESAVKAIEQWMITSENATHECTATAFLQYLKYKDVQDKLMDDRDAVKLMTVHGSKGLEFDTVILGGMNQGIFPSKRGDIEEERRLAYVAITRAKNQLYITSARQTPAWSGELVEAKPSQFISEMTGMGGASYDQLL